jgi:signal transduction histidine kinase
MAIPLQVGGQVVGVIDVQSPRANAFSVNDERMLVTVAGQLAIIIQNARLYAQTHRRLDELTILSELALAGASTLDLSQVLDRMLQVIRRTLQFESFEIILYNPSTGMLCTEAGYGALFRARDQDMPLGQGIIGWVAEQGVPLLVPDVRQEPRYFEADIHTQSELAVPLKVGDQVIGVMNVESPYLNRFTPDDQRLLTVLAGQMAVIIQNARLHAETQRRLAHATTLYTFAQQLSTNLDMNALLDSIVVLLKRILRCRAANIWLINPASQLLEIRAAAGLQSKWKREARLKIGVGIAGQVAATAQPIYVPDTHQIDFVFFDHAVRSLLCVPLMVHERVIGVLAVDSDYANAFTPDDELLLTVVAAQASVAIENAQLFEDVTERASKLEQAYSDLQEADRLKDELVQNMSHEIKTPLTFVKGYIELLLEGDLGALSEAQCNSLRIVSEKTDAITRLVNDIILLQQIERGSLRITALDLAELAQRIVADFETQSSIHTFTVSNNGLAVRPVVMADVDRISQVFNNLIGNAVKFSPNGGPIVIQFQDKGDMIEAVVRDTGIGIPEQLLDKVFERFYQVDGSSTRQYGGTGLGLAIVKRIIAAHQGQVWVESQLGQGSSFYFTLPKTNLFGTR